MSVSEMIKNFEEYKTERYQKLELEFLKKSGEFFSKNFATLRKNFLQNLRLAIKNAVEIQKIEKNICAYISVSFLNTSVIEKNPTLQIDFYDEDWVYGKSWASSRVNADFILNFWESFIADALDESFYIRSQISKVQIKSKRILLTLTKVLIQNRRRCTLSRLLIRVRTVRAGMLCLKLMIMFGFYFRRLAGENFCTVA